MGALRWERRAYSEMVRLAAIVFASLSMLNAGTFFFDLPATDGTRVRPSELQRSRATVLLFLASDCPISNRYSPVFQELHREYAQKGVRFYAVFSGAAATADVVRKHLADFSLPMPGLLDVKAELARETGAVVTPEAVVLAPNGAVLYRGRIDNRYVDWGKTRPEATEHDLADALDAVLAGRAVLHPVTKALGCAIAGAG